MCENESLPTVLVWTFIAGAMILAGLSRKLNAHLLEIPPQPTGPFSILFRRKYHVRPRFLFDPESYFDADGQRWVLRFNAVAIWCLAVLAALAYLIVSCDIKIGG
jgi:hypothetical protein